MTSSEDFKKLKLQGLIYAIVFETSLFAQGIIVDLDHDNERVCIKWDHLPAPVWHDSDPKKFYDPIV